MSTPCPFCAGENAPNALVCRTCARDIAIPASLLAERDNLLKVRDVVRTRLAKAREELEALRLGIQNRSV
jgi:hypothetical protein